MSLITPSFGLLFWMVVIFGLVLLILAKAGFPIITGMVRKRSDHIAASLEEAGEARRQVEGVREDCRKMMDEARHEQSRLLEEAKKSAQQLIDDAKAQASVEAAQMIARTKEEIEVQKREAMAELRNVVADVSVAVSEKILMEKLSNDKAQIDLVNRILDEARPKDRS